MDEVVRYYARSRFLRGNACARIHVFADYLDSELLHDLLNFAAASPRNAAEVRSHLESAYLGFVVVRPLPAVPIGRTVLRPPQHDSSWITTTSYNVHIFGFELSVSGLGFQQQDGAVAACATTAIWTALQKVVPHEGDRAPTPPQITSAAAKGSSPERAAAHPAMTEAEMWSALRELEYPPHVFGPEQDPDFFFLLLQTYLRSGIPVILCSRTKPLAHAVTAVGYAAATKRHGKLRFNAGSVLPSMDDLEHRNLFFRHLYVHDDRTGPYIPARVRVERKPNKVFLDLQLPASVEASRRPELPIMIAGAPLYPKLRTNAAELYGAAVRMAYTLQQNLGYSKKQMTMEMFFAHAGTYSASLLHNNLDSARLLRFLMKVAFSRYVGIARFSIDGVLLLDSLWDTTDRIASGTFLQHLVGFVTYAEPARASIDEMALAYHVPNA